jgi:polar amino acid transport system ATP-binding protein
MTARSPGQALLEARGLRLSHGRREVLCGVDLTIAAGERVAVLGANGSGKTTLLRVLAGLDRADAGVVTGDVDGARVGLVLQQGALFPHLSVLRNVELALRVVERLPREACARRAMAALARVNVDRPDAMPHELSGGLQQRVAIARALALEPRVLLLDEPTSALDPTATADIARTLVELSDAGMAIVFVTHDIAFAERVATRTMRLVDGRLAPTAPGSPRDDIRDPRPIPPA